MNKSKQIKITEPFFFNTQDQHAQAEAISGLCKKRCKHAKTFCYLKASYLASKRQLHLASSKKEKKKKKVEEKLGEMKASGGSILL